MKKQQYVSPMCEIIAMDTRGALLDIVLSKDTSKIVDDPNDVKSGNVGKPNFSWREN
ncbi:MAG: hypothetical protein J6H19_00555 [Bacteroidaceae bacterium]|jgi:hypothetical protein|nr:hypothetical protein [Bacteroidaceae bacterium]MBQ2030006.1 hypothetical protein [Bacteroidaceae bacterium]